MESAHDDIPSGVVVVVVHVGPGKQRYVCHVVKRVSDPRFRPWFQTLVSDPRFRPSFQTLVEANGIL